MDVQNTQLTFPSLFEETVRKHGDSNAFSFVDEQPLTYSDSWYRIRSLIAFIEKTGIKPGDRVAILSSNMPNWAIVYFSLTFMGVVAVPVLPDFTAGEVFNVLEHSGSRLIFVSRSLLPKIENSRPDNLKTGILIENFSVIFSQSDLPVFDPEALPSEEYIVAEDDLASIIYTSGTTGRSKGVMLTHKNISFNALKASIIQPVQPDDRFLSILPLSHTYENTLGLILPMIFGACVYYLGKAPTPAVLLPALEKVKPTIMLSVPLIIEKIYFNKILPAFNSKLITTILYRLPFIRKILNAAAGKKLYATFGGRLKFFGIGGAKLNKAVERFLIEAKFPYAVGYGLTETAPLLAGANPEKTVLESTGPAIEGIELKINNPDIHTGEGEIWARGPMVMKGYYNEPELTAEVLTTDGWFKTGDLGHFDVNKNLYIRGRIKNMILGASGENIYPEDIESVINSFKYVIESLVVHQKGRLVALVHLNTEELEMKYEHLKKEMSEKFEEKKQELLTELKDYVNSQVNKFSRINEVVLQPVPFQKTATLKIKRYLYT